MCTCMPACTRRRIDAPHATWKYLEQGYRTKAPKPSIQSVSQCSRTGAPVDLGLRPRWPLGNHMTQRTPTLASSPSLASERRARALRRMREARLDARFGVSSRDVAAVSESPMDLACRWGYMAVCILALAGSAAMATGEAATAELRFATAAVVNPAPAADICSADAVRAFRAYKQACANARMRSISTAGDSGPC